MLYGKIETRWVFNGQKPPFPLGKYLIYSCKTCYDFHEAEKLMGDQLDDAHKAFKQELSLEKGTIDKKTREFLLGHAICIGDLVQIIDPITPETNIRTFVEYVVP